VGMLPDGAARPLMERAGIDRLSALLTAIDLVRRGGTVSVSGVYGGAVDPLPLLKMFDKQIQLRMGQANVRNWVPHILPLLVDDDPLGVDGFATHHLPLADGPKAYETFQQKADGMVKTLLTP
jgi:threonine dehydrogenase-like Zn-dependent dehydrogenase